ncbi:hypothetical protein M758_8G117200 [Ceratodon purpureus]|nr:hypothetical protein M758_8G117200 [Ceratodon purpureus]
MKTNKPSNYKGTMCTNCLEAECKNGENCIYAHGEEDLKKNRRKQEEKVIIDPRRFIAYTYIPNKQNKSICDKDQTMKESNTLGSQKCKDILKGEEKVIIDPRRFIAYKYIPNKPNKSICDKDQTMKESNTLGSQKCKDILKGEDKKSNNSSGLHLKTFFCKTCSFLLKWFA